MDIFPKCLFAVVNAFFIITDAVYSSTLGAPPPATTTPDQVTTLASTLILHNTTTVIILVGSLLIGVPFVVICCCGVKSLIGYRREKKIQVKDEEKEYSHPAPEHPPPRPFLQRDNTIAGPFQNPAFNDEDDVHGNGPSRTVTPSFIQTRVVDEPGFGMNSQQRFKYIP